MRRYRSGFGGVWRKKIGRWSPEEIREFRVAIGLTLSEFADLLKLNFESIYEWENGDRRPSEVYRECLSNLHWLHTQGALIVEHVKNSYWQGGIDDE